MEEKETQEFGESTEYHKRKLKEISDDTPGLANGIAHPFKVINDFRKNIYHISGIIKSKL